MSETAAPQPENGPGEMVPRQSIEEALDENSIAADAGAPSGDSGGEDPKFGTELSTIDFGQILGGPLVAAVNAEAQSSMMTLQFIEAVGFQSSKSGGNGGSSHAVQTVDFEYQSQQGDVTTTDTLTVPLLSIVPIPSMRVSQLSVNLNVKLHSLYQSSSTNSFTNTDNISSSGLFNMFSPVNFQCSIVDQSNSSTSDQVERDYNLSVKMLAVQDSMPAGLAKVLQILQDTIVPAPAVKS